MKLLCDLYTKLNLLIHKIQHEVNRLLIDMQ